MKTFAKTIAVSFLFLSTQSALAQTTSYAQQIKTLASKSACTSYSWKNRGRAPAGYIKGMALSFARSVCRVKVESPIPAVARILSAPSSGVTGKDALAYYASTFSSLGIKIKSPGEDAVRAVYSLGIGLGMRESSGKYCEGWDRSAGSRRSSAEGEAGLFQVSYDSMGMSTELRKLYQEYQASPSRCNLAVFKEGASCSSQSVLGTGAGATYQAFNKSCPAFAAEYAMTVLRLHRTHFGPINRKEAQVVSSCGTLLTNVQNLIESDPQSVCAELY
jgi:hypothetical protein